MENKDKQSFKCPTILAQYLKYQMIEGVKDFSVRNLGALKFADINIFSPNGFVCEVWRRFTEAGRWNHTHFCFQQKEGHYTFAYSAIPTRIIDDIAPEPDNKVDALSPLRSFLLFSTNKKEDLLDVLNRMEDFNPEIPAYLEKEKPQLDLDFLFRTDYDWKVEANIVKDNIVSHWMSVPMKGPTAEAVKLSFYLKFPNAQVLKVLPATPSVF